MKLEKGLESKYWFMRQGSGTRVSAGVISRKSCQKLLPCLAEPMPARSKMDPLLAKAKQTSDDSNVSVMAYLRSQNSYSSEGIAMER